MSSRIDDVRASVYTFPTPQPESDGTLTWDATTAVVVTIAAGGTSGLGWRYCTAAAARIVTDHLAGAIEGLDCNDVARCWSAMHRACRNLGTRGVVMDAISAVDIALWDLKARQLDVSLYRLLGQVRDRVRLYGSGGFTSMTDDQLADQVEGWRSAGCSAMKIKIGEAWGTREERDLDRVALLRKLAGRDVALMVDANGGYERGQARRIGAQLDESGVVWFEEPVSSDDPAGLAQLRTTLRCDVTAGEYVADLTDAQVLIGALDCLQLDVTRCGGYTGFLRAAALAQAHQLPVSGHCAPALHLPVACAVPNLRHVEWFADHARLEPLLVDGVPDVRAGAMAPSGRPGHGYELRDSAAPYAASGSPDKHGERRRPSA
jgi:L-alanine-DL-glutamate epimerase-like enolase superfamily enzyme